MKTFKDIMTGIGVVILLLILGSVFGALLIVLGVLFPIILPLSLCIKGVRKSIPGFSVSIGKEYGIEEKP